MRAVVKMVGRIFIFAAIQAAGIAAPESPRPADPCDIVRMISLHTLPRIEFQKGTTVKEALAFLYSRYENNAFSSDPPSSTIYRHEYRLPDGILNREVSFQAKDIRMIDAIKKTLAGVPVALTFEPGKLIFHSRAATPPK